MCKMIVSFMRIDGTDYRIQQKGITKKGNLFGSHKYAGKSALLNKLGIDILAGSLVWVLGPYPVGQWTDIKIFDDILSNLLKPDKCVEADNGYVGCADKVKCLNNDCNPQESGDAVGSQVAP